LRRHGGSQPRWEGDWWDGARRIACRVLRSTRSVAHAPWERGAAGAASRTLTRGLEACRVFDPRDRGGHNDRGDTRMFVRCPAFWASHGRVT
jgi:hypothetical protein